MTVCLLLATFRRHMKLSCVCAVGPCTPKEKYYFAVCLHYYCLVVGLTNPTIQLRGTVKEGMRTHLPQAWGCVCQCSSTKTCYSRTLIRLVPSSRCNGRSPNNSIVIEFEPARRNARTLRMFFLTTRTNCLSGFEVTSFDFVQTNKINANTSFYTGSFVANVREWLKRIVISCLLGLGTCWNFYGHILGHIPILNPDLESPRFQYQHLETDSVGNIGGDKEIAMTIARSTRCPFSHGHRTYFKP